MALALNDVLVQPAPKGADLTLNPLTPKRNAKIVGVPPADIEPLTTGASAIANPNILTDSLINLGQGALKLPGEVAGLADIPAGLVGMDRPISKAADYVANKTGLKLTQMANDANKDLSPELKAAKENINKAWETGSAGDIANAYADNPRATASNVVESLPMMAASGGIGRAAKLVLPSLSAPAAFALGDGALTAGDTMSNIDPNVDPQKAAAAALVDGAFTGGVDLASGHLANKLGLENAGNLLAGGRLQTASNIPAAARIAGGAGLEAGEEALQNPVDQLSQNYAEDKPLSQGVARAGVEGALAGGVMGGGANAASPGTYFQPVLNKFNPAANPQDAELQRQAREQTAQQNGFQSANEMQSAMRDQAPSSAVDMTASNELLRQAREQSAKQNGFDSYAEMQASNKKPGDTTTDEVKNAGQQASGTADAGVVADTGRAAGAVDSGDVERTIPNPGEAGQSGHTDNLSDKDSLVGKGKSSGADAVPFATENTANQALTNRGLAKSHSVVEHNGGFALKPNTTTSEKPGASSSTDNSGTNGDDAASINANGSDDTETKGADSKLAEPIAETKPPLAADDKATQVKDSPKVGGDESQPEGVKPADNFTATHELSDGTPVVKEDDGSFTDQQGDNYADDGHVSPITKTEAKTDEAKADFTNAPVPVPAGSDKVTAPTNSAAGKLTKEADQSSEQVQTKPDAKVDSNPVKDTQANYDNVTGLIKKTDGNPFDTEPKAKQALKNKASLNNNEHDIVPVTGGFAIAPTKSLSFDQYKALPRNKNFSSDVAAQSYEAETGKKPEVTTASIDAAAHEAATSPTNDTPQPTQAQIEAGNYKKGHVLLHGLDISIENPKGSTRSGVDKDGTPWENTMASHYGYVKGSIGADKEHVDVFIGDKPESTKAFVVNQIHPHNGKFDEHKVMLGFDTEEAARAGYLENYAKGWKGLDSITEMPVSEIKEKIESGPVEDPINHEDVATDKKNLTVGDGEIIHARQRIYPTTIKGEHYYTVESDENKNRRLAGDRNRGGDNLFKSLKEAKDYADLERERANQRESNEREAEIEAKESKAKKSIADDTDGFADQFKPMQRGAVIKTLNSQVNIGGNVDSIKNHVKALLKNDQLPNTEEENKIKDKSRTEWNRMDNSQQQAHERKTKEGGKKTVYRIGGFDLGKTAHDYAEHLIKAQNENDNDKARPVPLDAGTKAGGAGETVGNGEGQSKVSSAEEKVDTSTAEMDDLKSQMGQAIGELASLLGGKHNLTEEEEARILPIMSKIFRIAAKMGYVKFKDSAGYVMQQIRELAGDNVADKLAIHNLQAGYINMGGNIRDTLDYDSIGQLEKDYVKSELKQPENNDDHRENNDTGTKANAGNDSGKAPAQSGISDKQPGQHNQGGTQDGDSGVRTGQKQPNAVDTGKGQGNELPGNEGLAGHGTDASNQPAIEQPDSDNGSVSKHPGADNYSLIGKPNIALTPAKRRDVNVLAAEILKKPVDDITEDDKNILRQYTGNGGLDLESSKDKGAGIFNQHYTAYDTIKAMYGALLDAGVKMVNNLEPSVGSGNFIGMHPRANWTAVDIDKTNAEIVERLYPDAKVFNESYETFRGKNYDLIISNVPFASFSSLAREHAGTIKPAFKAIHNFFFAQSVDKLKTGGVMAFMTSTGTMDGSGEAQSLRNHLIKQMDVIGAYRLPMGSQKANASTEVMIDVIFLQKRPEGVPSKQPEKNQAFADIANKEGHNINQYFVDYPESVLGELSVGANKTAMGKIGWIVTGKADYSKIKVEPQDYTSTEKRTDKANDFSNHETAQAYADKHGYKFVDQETKPFFKDGIIYDTPVTYNEQEGGGLFGRKATGVNADKLAVLQKIDETHDAELVHQYEEKYGKPPHTDKLLEAYAKGNHAAQQLKSYLALFDKHFNLSEIFTKQVRFKDSGKIEIDEHSPLLDRAESLENADGVISSKSNLVSPEEKQELLDNGDYAQLGNGSLQNARLYYAGNIYKKLDDAAKVKPAAQRDKQLAKLEKVKPELIPIKDISITGKESWLPGSAIASIGKKTYSDGAVIIGENAIADNHLLHLFNQYVNNEPLVAKDKDVLPEEYAERLKAAQSTLHNEVIPLIKQKLMDDGLADEVVDAYNRAKNFFAPPVFDGSSLRNLPETFKGKPFSLMLHQKEGAERAIYNKKGVLAFSPGLGKTPTAIIVADQLLQKSVMKKPLFIVPANTIPQWESSTRSLYPDAKVYEFPKYTSGINKGKPKEWPSMTASDKEKMVYDLTNNQYDYTFISTNLAQKFSVPTAKLSQYLDELTESISGMEKPDDELTKAQIKAKETRLAKIRMLKATMMAAYRDSSTAGFDMGKMGFDALFADEVQYYKNIGMQSEDAKGGIGANVAINAKYPMYSENGKMVADKTQDPLSVTLGSSRSYDFRFKTRFISENNNGNNVFLLTGTPTPNKPLELMTLLHHLDIKILDEYGINNVGDFVDEFLDVQEVEEMGIDGSNKMNPQLVGIKNIFGMKKIISRFVDYRSPESAKDLTRPKQIDKTHIILQNEDANSIFADIQARILQSIEDAKAKMSGDKGVVVEPMIKMYGAGRDGSIDARLYRPSDDNKGGVVQVGTVFQKETRAEYSKIAKTVELVAAKNKQDPEAGQLIFLDRLKFADGSGSTHEDIRNDILKSTGLAPQQVVFVNGGEYVNPTTGKIAKSIKPEMLQKIMDDYNAGKIKVLIGNTSKLGVGVDLQTTTTDIYQIDKPYRPDEIEQRNNRGVRQGNRNAEVTVHTFNQPGTFDAMSDRIIANKQGFNDVFWKDQDSDRADVKGEEAPGHYDAAIELEQNPIKKRKLEIERDLSQASGKTNQIEKQISSLAKRIRIATQNLDAYTAANKGIDTRETPKYEDQTEAERKKSIVAFKKRMAEQREKNNVRIAGIKTDLIELNGDKESRAQELIDHKGHIAEIRDRYVVNGVVSLDAIRSSGDVRPSDNNAFNDLTNTRLSSKDKLADEAITRILQEERDKINGASHPLKMAVNSAKLRKVFEALDSDQITKDEALNRIAAIYDEMVIGSKVKQLRSRGARVRGADFITQKLLEAKRRGDISGNELDFAKWFIQQNPGLIDDLGISIKSSNSDDGSAGNYNPAARIMTLIKGHSGDTTAVHEILHHLERMMPEEMQDEIKAAWLRDLVSARTKAEKAGKTDLVKFFDNALLGLTDKAIKSLRDSGENVGDFYQFTNPSEYWAVNGTNILHDRFADRSVIATIKTWLKEAYQHIKGFFGLDSNAPILRAIDNLLNNKDAAFISKSMLTENNGSKLLASHENQLAANNSDGGNKEPPIDNSSSANEDDHPGFNNGAGIYGSLLNRAQGHVKDLSDWFGKFGALGSLPEKEQYLAQRYRTLGNLAKVEEISKSVYDTFAKASKDDAEAIYRYLTTKDATVDEIHSVDLRNAARDIKKVIAAIGQQLVDRGFLDQETFDKHEGTYLPRVYLKHILGDKLFSALGSGKTPSDLGYLKQRKDIPEEVRRLILMEIKDPAYLTGRALNIPMRDIAIFDWFNQIADNKSWVWDQSYVTIGLTDKNQPEYLIMPDGNGLSLADINKPVDNTESIQTKQDRRYKIPTFKPIKIKPTTRTRKVTPFFLAQEAARMRRQAHAAPEADRADILGLADAFDEVANTAIKNMTTASEPKDFIQMPKSARYGALAGLIVRKEIHDDIVGTMTMFQGDPSIAQKILGDGGVLAKYTSIWKFMKVAANPPSHVRNIMSNLVLLQLSGVSFHQVPQRVFQAMNEIRNGGKHWDVAKQYGVTQATFANTELFRMNRELNDLIVRNQNSNSWDKLKAVITYNVGKGVDTLGDWYQFMEAVGKVAKIIDMMEKGNTPEKSAIAAHEALFDYSLVPNSVRYLRNAPIGVPFASFYVKALPQLVKVAVTHPERYLPYILMFKALGMLVAAQHDVDDDDLDKLKKALPEWLQEKGHAYFLPGKDSQGRWQAVDFGYFVPWTLYTEFSKDAMKGDVGAAMATLGILGSPVADLITAIKTGIDPFTRKPIVDKFDTPAGQLGDIFNYLWRMNMPTFLTDIGWAGKVMEAYTGEVDKQGQPKATMAQAMWRLAGVNIYGIDPEAQRAKNIRFKRNDMIEARIAYRNALRDRNIDDSKRERITDQYTKTISGMADELNKYVTESEINPKLITNNDSE